MPVRIACPKAASGACSGKATLQTASKVRVPGRKDRRIVTLATDRFRAARGKSTNINLQLTATARKLLKARSNLRAKLTLTGKDGTGANRTTTKTFNLKVPGRRAQR